MYIPRTYAESLVLTCRSNSPGIDDAESASTSTFVTALVFNAIVFGAELAEGKTYLYGQECKAAVFTWQGCTIEMSTALCLPSAPSAYMRALCVYLSPWASTSQAIPPSSTSPTRRP